MDVNQPCGPQGRTALHAAAEHGQCSCCSVLLELGADSYMYDERQVSALMLAAMHGHERVVQVCSCCLTITELLPTRLMPRRCFVL